MTLACSGECNTTMMCYCSEDKVGMCRLNFYSRKFQGFLFSDAGWAFPKRIYFSGENCVMPFPADFPRLPKEKWNVGK